MPLDLEELRKKLEESLSNETKESLTKFLEDQRKFNRTFMTLLKQLSVKVTYTVSLSELEIPERAYNEILEACEKHENIVGSVPKYCSAAEWLESNINEGQCCHWEYEITEITAEENFHGNENPVVDDSEPIEEKEFDSCSECDLPDACADYGCAVKQGIKQVSW